jgi:hypothetical protein
MLVSANHAAVNADLPVHLANRIKPGLDAVARPVCGAELTSNSPRLVSPILFPRRAPSGDHLSDRRIDEHHRLSDALHIRIEVVELANELW